MDFTIYHADHGINDHQMDYIKLRLESNKDLNSFLIQEVKLLVQDHGYAPCALYGPAMGDEPITDDMVRMEKRSEDRPADRLIKAHLRCVDYVQAIGIMDRDKDTCTLFTVYGGPLAPQNPEDPTLPEEGKAESVEFWSKHALVG